MAIPRKQRDDEMGSPTSRLSDPPLNGSGETDLEAPKATRGQRLLAWFKMWALTPVPFVLAEEEPHDLRTKLTLWALLGVMGGTIAFG